MTAPAYLCQECGGPIPVERAQHAVSLGRQPKWCSLRHGDNAAGRKRRERLARELAALRAMKAATAAEVAS